MAERYETDDQYGRGRLADGTVRDRDDAWRGRGDEGIEEARERFGGLDLPASLTGMLVALAALLLLSGIASAIFGAVAFQSGVRFSDRQEVAVGGLVVGAVVLVLSFLLGGWAAGRMARYSGALNGFMTALWFVILMALLALLGGWAGDRFNLFDNLRVAQARLPNWFSPDTLTTAAAISAIVAVVLMFVAAVVGGIWGERMHRRADAVIATTREGGLRPVPADEPYSSHDHDD